MNDEYDETDEMDTDPAEEEEEEETEEDGDELERSLTSGSLLDAIEDFETIAKAQPAHTGDRTAYLEARHRAGTLTKSERSELGRIWTGEAPVAEPVTKSLMDRLEDAGDGSRQLVDASDFLTSLVKSLEGVLGGLREESVRDGQATRRLVGAQGELLKAVAVHADQLGNVVRQQGTLIKSLQQRLGIVESTPAAPRSRVTSASARTAPRSTGNLAGTRSDGGGSQLSKSQLLNGLDRMMIKAVQSGNPQQRDAIALAASKLESFNVIDPPMLAQVEAELTNG